MRNENELRDQNLQCNQVGYQDIQNINFGGTCLHNMVSNALRGHVLCRLGRALGLVFWFFFLLALTGCYSNSRLVRSEVVIDGLVGTTVDADVFNSSNDSGVGVDFGSVRVFAGAELGSRRFWPTPMGEHYDKKENGISECFGRPDISIKELSTGLYQIKARFRAPGAIAHSMTQKAQTEGWLAACECPEEVGATCFENYVIREIEKRLTKDIGSSLGGSTKANIPLSDRLQMKRRLGTLVQTRRRILTGELGVYQRKRDTDVIPHNIERLDPGKRICFQSYSFNRGPEVKDRGAPAGRRVSALVPGALSCMNWLGLIRPATGLDGRHDLVAGLDPVTLLGEGWAEPDEGYFRPVDDNRSPGEVDYWAPLDRITDNSKSSFPFALLFTSNYKQTLLLQDDRDLRYPSGMDSSIRRSNILLLFKNAALRDFVQQHYAFESDTVSSQNRLQQPRGCIKKGTAHKHFHNCVTTLVEVWLELQKQAPDAFEGAEEDYFHDLVMPSNIRPFTQIPVYLNGELRWIRTGTSLLSVLDEKFRLSENVMRARAAESGVATPPHNEAALVKRALAKVSLKRRRAGTLVRIKLDRLTSLDGLALPLVPGDELSWWH
ncbi:hypothetical protein [Marinobacter salexigens]|uniref:hypothetical protein n=1 Tax=Marinobacter salexigens TaxID=1925763 RepID=UPI000C28192A|nr:hypothetical protein [Marinobacter salexigens]